MREQRDGDMRCGEGIGRQSARAHASELRLYHSTTQRNPKPSEPATMFTACEQIESGELGIPTRRGITRCVRDLGVAVAMHLFSDRCVSREPVGERGDGLCAPGITEHLGEDRIAECAQEQGVEGARRCLRSGSDTRRALRERIDGANSRCGGGRKRGALNEVPSVCGHGGMVTRAGWSRERRRRFLNTRSHEAVMQIRSGKTYSRAVRRAAILALPCVLAAGTPAPQRAVQSAPLTIRAGTLLDGRGGVQRDVVLTIDGSRITRIAPWRAGTVVTWDLSNRTVLPGLIDTHVHIDGHFGADGRANNRGETPEQRLRAAMENAQRTLRAGFTTVQSLGAAIDLDLRREIAEGRSEGPRILTSVAQFSDTSRTPEQIRDWVRATAARGADVIKIFASRSIRDGGGQTLSDAQISAACDEARRAGLRSWVHAHAASAVRAAANAGCTGVTHGTQSTATELALMAQRGTYFEPNIGLVIQNYLENRARFVGVGNFTEEGFRFMEDVVPKNLAVFREAMRTPGLKLVMGTDAVAGAHGQNAREIVYRVREAGQANAEAIRAATSLAAQALGIADSIGTVAVGRVADLIAVEGDPLTDITALQRIVFVMKGGTAVIAPERRDRAR